MLRLCDSSPSTSTLFRLKRVWPEAAALQAQVHEHLWQLQVLLSQRIHAYAGRVLLKYVRNLNCFISALGLISFMLCSGSVRMRAASYAPLLNRMYKCVLACVPEELKIKIKVAPFR